MSVTDSGAITGLVLAGGRGTRMGEVDKGLQPFRGAPMAEHVLQRLAPQVATIAISANQNLERYAALGVPVWPDDLQGFAGPLAGLETGLRRCGTGFLVTAPCDAPFLPPDLVARLAQAIHDGGADLALAETLETDADGATRIQPHPVFALMKTAVLPHLSAYLAGGGRRMDGWYAGLQVARVRFEQAADFRNINTLSELQLYQDQSVTPVSPLEQAAQSMPDPLPNGMPVPEAQRRIAALIGAAIDGVDHLALEAALGRVLASDIISPISVPAHDNSAMDGYALRSADLATGSTTILAVVGTTYAGRPTDAVPGPGQCVRIMTGGVMPAGCDTVIAQENVVDAGSDSIGVAAGTLLPGANRRLAGEDLMAGSAALKAGRMLRPSDLGLLASLGIAAVPLRRRLKVAVFSTGDELCALGQPLAGGCVYDSNRYTLAGMLTRLGCEVIDLGIVRDQPDALEAALRSACIQADVILTSGGVSDGAADHTRQIMARLGEVAFWKIAMRPGRPLAFGRIASYGNSAWLFGLPGNPVAVMVSFYCFARGALLRMMGADAPLVTVKARSADVIRKRPGRTEYQRAILAPGADGMQEVRLTGAQGSGILRSMSEANCMVVLPEDQASVAAGELVDVMLFDGLI